MAKANTPPKNSGRALPRVYLAQQGQSKVCDTCRETKEIARNTFGPDRKSPDGIASTCRACVGRRGAMLRHHGLDEHGQKIDGPKSEEGDPRQRWPDPVRDSKAYWARVVELCEQMYRLGRAKDAHRQLSSLTE